MADARAKTKRRKVFVNEYSDGLLLLAAKLSRKEAVKGRGCNARTVCFVESSPGDVVLSQWQVNEVRRLRSIGRSEEALDLIMSLRGGR